MKISGLSADEHWVKQRASRLVNQKRLKKSNEHSAKFVFRKICRRKSFRLYAGAREHENQSRVAIWCEFRDASRWRRLCESRPYDVQFHQKVACGSVIVGLGFARVQGNAPDYVKRRSRRKFFSVTSGEYHLTIDYRLWLEILFLIGLWKYTSLS